MNSLRVHHRWVTVLGAFLVFMTFVAKDYLRDSAKDELAEISTAKSEYTAKVDHDELLRAIHDASDARRWSDGGSGTDTSFSDVPTFSDLLAAGRMATTVDFSQLLEQTDILGMKLRDDREVMSNRSAAYQNNEKIPTAIAKFNVAFSQNNPKGPNFPANRYQVDAERQLEKAVFSAGESSDKYHITTMSKANARQAAKQHEYARFTRWSWFLFALGWAVTLVGKMLEPECAIKDAPEFEA